MLRLKPQYFGHLMQGADSLEKTLMLEKIEGRRRRRWQRTWYGWMASPTQLTWVWVSSRRWWRTGKPGVLQSMGLQRVRHDLSTEQQPSKHIQNPTSFHIPTAATLFQIAIILCLDYCNSLLAGLPASVLDPLQSILIRAFRMIWLNSITPLLKTFQCIPFHRGTGFSMDYSPHLILPLSSWPSSPLPHSFCSSHTTLLGHKPGICFSLALFALPGKNTFSL